MLELISFCAFFASLGVGPGMGDVITTLSPAEMSLFLRFFRPLGLLTADGHDCGM